MGAIYPDLKESTRLINTRRATDKTLSCFWNEFVCYLVLFYSLYARWEKKATLGESLNDYVRLFTVIRTQHNVTNEIYSLLYWQFQYFQNLYPNWIDFCWNFFFFKSCVQIKTTILNEKPLTKFDWTSRGELDRPNQTRNGWTTNWWFWAAYS